MDPPAPGPDQVLIRVKATGINPGEAKIREGLLHSRFPATFPSGEGSDVAGVIEQVGAGVDGFAVGDEVIGVASERHHDWLEARGVILVGYGEGMQERIRSAAGGPVDALIDTVGSGYVELALDLGVRPERIDTIADFQAAEKFGVQVKGNAAGASADVLAELAALVEQHEVEIPIAATYPLDQVREVFGTLEQGYVRGKIVLVP